MGDIDAMAVGLAAWRLGAGRSRPGERVQSGAGVRIHRRPGEPVAAGEPLFTLYTDTPERFGAAMAELDGGWSVGDDTAGFAAADHRSDRQVSTPLDLRADQEGAQGPAARSPRRRAAPVDRAGDRRPDRLRRAARHRRRRAGHVVSHPVAQRLAGALPGAVLAHRGGDADARRAASRRLRVRGRPGRRFRGLRRDPIRARVAHRPRAVLRRDRRRRAGGFRRRREGLRRSGPPDRGAAVGHRHAPRRGVPGDRRAGNPVPGQGCCRVRHRRRRGRQPADAAPGRLRVHARPQRALHYSRR